MGEETAASRDQTMEFPANSNGQLNRASDLRGCDPFAQSEQPRASQTLGEEARLLLQQGMIVAMQEAEAEGSSGLAKSELDLLLSQLKERCEENGLAVLDMDFFREFMKTPPGIETLLRTRLKVILEEAENPGSSGCTAEELLLLAGKVNKGCALLGLEPPDMRFLMKESRGVNN